MKIVKMTLDDIGKKIEDCNDRIKQYNSKIANIMAEENTSSEEFSILISEVEKTIDELQELILLIE
jgi:hypothetical protein